MNTLRLRAWLGLCLGVASCTAAETERTGGQTGDEGFTGSQCSKLAASEPTSGVNAAALSRARAGLECVTWGADDEGVVRVELTQVTGPCLVEVDWQGRATSRGSALDLVASGEPECRIAGCGSCVYDFTFEHRVESLDEPIALSFALETCEEPAEPSVELTLPIDVERQGIACRQIPAGTLTWLGPRGQAHLPCEDTHAPSALIDADAGTSERCDAGLTCHALGDAGEICLTPCGTDDDCPLQGIESCEQGLCQVPPTF